METVAGSQRLIGNIVLQTDFGEIVGYENHSGLTTLHDGQLPFGEAIAGAGNNGKDNTEGARSFNMFGSYLHGPILPKNPVLADELLRLATMRKYNEKELLAKDEASKKKLEKLDMLAMWAREIAKKRPR
jgi:CobQ-like glutamine amidotransferase family enzyme